MTPTTTNHFANGCSWICHALGNGLGQPSSPAQKPLTPSLGSSNTHFTPMHTRKPKPLSLQRLNRLLHRVRARRIAIGWLLVFSSASQAGMGIVERAGETGRVPLTVFYPTAQAEQPVKKGPFDFSLAVNAQPDPGRHPLVVISHGSGGSPWDQVDLARTLVENGFVVVMPEHHQDNYKDFSNPGPSSWKLRPAEVSQAIDLIAQDPLLGPVTSTEKVGVYGGSAGGHTALSLAGGQWSPARFRDHCEAHIAEDFSSCVGFIIRLNGGWLDGLKKQVAKVVIRWRFGDATPYRHEDRRIRAVIAAVPFAADFDLSTLVTPVVPLGLILARQDINQIPRFHGQAVQRMCTSCTTIADMPYAGHGVMLSPLPPLGSTDSIAYQLLSDPPGFDRKQLPALHQKVADFFKQHFTRP
jgi:predicted dienelactone hydrolase